MISESLWDKMRFETNLVSRAEWTFIGIGLKELYWTKGTNPRYVSLETRKPISSMCDAFAEKENDAKSFN